MSRHRALVLRYLTLAILICSAAANTAAAQNAAGVHPSARRSNAKSQAISRLQRKLPAAMRSRRAPSVRGGAMGLMALTPGTVYPPQIAPGIDYTLPNYANSPPLRK